MMECAFVWVFNIQTIPMKRSLAEVRSVQIIKVILKMEQLSAPGIAFIYPLMLLWSQLTGRKEASEQSRSRGPAANSSGRPSDGREESVERLRGRQNRFKSGSFWLLLFSQCQETSSWQVSPRLLSLEASYESPGPSIDNYKQLYRISHANIKINTRQRSWTTIEREVNCWHPTGLNGSRDALSRWQRCYRRRNLHQEIKQEKES